MSTTHQKSPITAVINFASGSIGGAVASVIVQPLDVIRTRMQQFSILMKQERIREIQSGIISNQINHPTHQGTALTANISNNILNLTKTIEQLYRMNTLEVGKFIVQHESIKGLWKGSGPTLFRIIPGAGLYFLFLDKISTMLKQRHGTDKSTPMTSLIAGSTARILVSGTMVPVTVVKTRFEAMGTNHYKGTIDAIRTIARTEGIKSLYSGLIATIIRDVPFSGIYYLFYEEIKNRLYNFSSTTTTRFSQVPHFVIHSGSGVLAGIIATTITHPTDVLKTRLQLPAQNGEKRLNMAKAFMQISTEEGIRGFYKGFFPRLIRRPLMTAITWAIYEETKIFLVK